MQKCKFESFGFCAGVENDPGGAESDDTLNKVATALGPHIKCQGINLFLNGLKCVLHHQTFDVFQFRMNRDHMIAILLQHSYRLVGIAMRFITGTEYNCRMILHGGFLTIKFVRAHEADRLWRCIGLIVN